ncbi:MAG: hypothetical protein HY748_10680 [Elusimicrobia bacterium]|nr:hypothetical protein [Elusimicrobiota bacterium]
MFWNWWKKRAKPTVENAPPETDISLPVLKKKEKEEERKSGIAPAARTKPGEIFIPARGGTGAASAARGAASQATTQAATRSSAWLFGNMLAGGLGLLFKGLLIGAAAIAVGGAGVVVYRLSAAGPRKAPLSFGAVQSEIQATGGDLAKSVMSSAKDSGMFSWIVPEAGRSDKAGAADAAGKTAKAGASGAAEAAGPTEGMGPAGETDPTNAFPGGGFGAPGGSQLSSILGGAVSQANFVLPGPKYGEKLGYRLSKFDNKSRDKGKGGSAKKTTVVMSPSLGNIRNRMRDSRSLGRLRAMAPYNAKIKGGGVSATEVEAGAAEAQFEGTENVGGTAPESPPDVPQPTPNPSPGGPGGPSGCQCNWETETCVNNQCVALDKPGPVETTPWARLTQKGQQLRTQVIIYMMIAAVLFTIAHYVKNIKPYGEILYWILFALGCVMALMSMAKAYEMIQVGKQINSMGGQPHGDQFIKMGYLYIAGNVAMIATAYFTPASKTAWQTVALINIAIMVICQLVGNMLK